MVYIEPPRLIVRDWKDSDLEPFSEMNADEEVMRFFPKTLSKEESDAFCQAIIAEIKECGYGLYAVELKATNKFIGFIGFHRATFESDFTPCIEIGWRLKKEAWGKGYATEGAKACLEYGFEELGFDEIYSFTADINEPSKQVMRKIGLEFVKEFDHPKVNPDSMLTEHVLYSKQRNEWKKS